MFYLHLHTLHLVKQLVSGRGRSCIFIIGELDMFIAYLPFFYRAMNQLLTYIRHIFLSTSILPLPVLLLLFIFLLLVLHIIAAIDKYISLSLLIFLSPYLCFTHTQTSTCAHAPDKNKPFV